MSFSRSRIRDGRTTNRGDNTVGAGSFGGQRERLMVIEVLASFFSTLHYVVFLGLNLAHVEFLRH